ncbi:MAG: hypothetical protein ACTH1T_03705, partial [Brachybacterium tyrofermentans]
MDAYRNEADRHAHLFRVGSHPAGFALIRRGEPTMVAECSRTDGPATAVELGCGIGVEARFLAESGFTVHTVDGDASVERPMAALSAQLPIHHTSVDLAQLRELPPADLLLSCATLPFVPQPAFGALWSRMRAALRPCGILAVDLFGDRDGWAGTVGTYLSHGDVEGLLDGLEILELTEDERDGRSFSGPKHWHTFRV